MKRLLFLPALVFLSTENVWGQNQKLVAGDAAEFDKFGWSIDLAGDRLIVGAPAKGDFGSNSGAAYIFGYSGSEWVEEAKLTAGDELAYNDFGYSVSIDGDYAAVGARTNYTGVGAVYMYRNSGDAWEEETKINCPDCNTMQAQALFGRSVSLKGDRVLIGAQQSLTSLYEAGIAYSYRREGEGWTLEKTFVPEDAVITAQFGWSVSLGDTYAVFGAPFDPISPNNPMGAAYVYRLEENEWLFDAKLVSEIVATSQLFGFSVAVSDSSVVIGSPGGTGEYGKRASVFEKEGGQWVRKGDLLSSDRSDNFGRSVAFADDDIIVGNTRYGAYLFEQHGGDWNFASKLEPEDPTYTTNEFGESVSINTQFIAVGDPSGVDGGGLKTGSVHVYEKASSVDRDEAGAVQWERLALSQNYPNPFGRNTTIRWQTPEAGWQSVKVYDMLGNAVATLVEGYGSAGEHEVVFTAEDLAPGMYVYRLSAGPLQETRKMLVLR